VGAVSGAALYPPGHAQAAGRLLAHLADDPQRRATYGAELRAHQRQVLDVDRFADTVLDWYLELLRQQPYRRTPGRPLATTRTPATSTILTTPRTPATSRFPAAADHTGDTDV